MTSIITTIPERCRRCYSCVRECPAKAIKVEYGQAKVLADRCIACGNCVKVCGQRAKQIESSVEAVRALLAGAEPVFAVVAPSFPAAFDTAVPMHHVYSWCYMPSYPEAFDQMTPGRVVTAIRRLGFTQVWEAAFGAEMVSRSYRELYEQVLNGDREAVISTACPAVVSYVRKYVPNLVSALAPVVSPMVATARVIRAKFGERARVVFIGPCVAKKSEIRDEEIAGEIDEALTFVELKNMIDEADLRAQDLEKSTFDSPPCIVGRAFALSGGLLRTAGLPNDVLQDNILCVDGKERVISAIEELAAGRHQARFLDVLFCEGCVSGPAMPGDLSVYARKQILAEYVKERRAYVSPEEAERALQRVHRISTERTYRHEEIQLPQPSAEEIQAALEAMRKTKPEDHLNCGACGYPTCRDKAIAVCQGLAEAEMCLPYLIEELESTCVRLQSTYMELADAQERLVQTEKLASMGQLSAGVAHEINNPLGSILLYSHVLLKQLGQNTGAKEDLEMIVREATRCKTIVRGLLDFARQSRVSKTRVDLREVIDDIISIESPAAHEAGVELRGEVDPDLGSVCLDVAQVKQMLVNLVQNAVDATTRGGSVTLSASANGRSVRIEVRDTGCGIPPENLSKIFEPFFTTKPMGKGTGLGLAIAYGVVKMHSGDITVDSVVGRGTTFRITLPVDGAPAERPIGVVN